MSLVTRLLVLAIIAIVFAFPWNSYAQLANANYTLALTNVTVIDGNGGRPQPNMTILISDGRIDQLFPTGSKKIPVGASVLKLDKHYVIPGLIDSHYHFMIGMRSKEAEESLRRFALMGGITSVRDMAGDAVALSELAKIAADGEVQSPRVYFSALMAGPSHLLGDRRVDQVSRGKPRGEAAWAKAVTADTDIVKAVSDAKATGATGIKLYTDLDPEIVTRIVAEAHRQGLKVWSHASIYPGKPSDAVKAGVDVISHSNLIVPEGMLTVPAKYSGSYQLLDYSSVGIEAKPISELLQLMLDKGTVLDPNMLVTARLGKTKPGDIFKDPARMAHWSNTFTLRAHIRRVPIVAGTDVNENPGTRDFPNLHTELELLVDEAGMTPLEAITAATRNGAQILGIADSYGTVGPGKVADLVVLSADPSLDIRNSTKIVYVIKGGVLHKRNTAADQKDIGDPRVINELRNLVKMWDDATAKGDAATLDRLLADEFSFVPGVRKAQYLEFVKTKTADTFVESAVSHDVQVQVYGDTAVVVGTDTVKGKNRGQSYENKYKYLDVWVKRDNRWQCVKASSTQID